MTLIPLHPANSKTHSSNLMPANSTNSRTSWTPLKYTCFQTKISEAQRSPMPALDPNTQIATKSSMSQRKQPRESILQKYHTTSTDTLWITRNKSHSHQFSNSSTQTDHSPSLTNPKNSYEQLEKKTSSSQSQQKEADLPLIPTTITMMNRTQELTTTRIPKKHRLKIMTGRPTLTTTSGKLHLTSPMTKPPDTTRELVPQDETSTRTITMKLPSVRPQTIGTDKRKRPTLSHPELIKKLEMTINNELEISTSNQPMCTVTVHSAPVTPDTDCD